MQKITSNIAVVIPCSKTKRKGKLEAKYKYNGRIYPYVLQLQKMYKFDLYIYSAKHGIISEHKKIDDYNVTFKGLSKSKREKKL